MPSVFQGLVPRDVMLARAHAGAYTHPMMPLTRAGGAGPLGAPPMPTISAGDVAAAAMGRTWAPPGHHGHMPQRSAFWHPYTGVLAGAEAAADPSADAAQAALAAISADPNFCVSVGQPGSAVNSAVHAFKAAWNAAHPDSPVPIGTGKFEDATAHALSTALGGGNVPGCEGGGGGPTPGPAPRPAPGPLPPPPPPMQQQAGICGTWGWKCILGAIAAAILGFLAMHAAKHHPVAFAK